MWIESAGFHHQTGRSCPEKMLRIGHSIGINLSGHRSTRVTQDQLGTADLVIVMDSQNLDQLRKEFPEMEERTTSLGLFATPGTLDIADPYSADAAATTRICGQIRAGVEGLVAWIGNPKIATCTPSVPSAAAGGR
jgi:protein-tyrosine-phosphatase